MNDSRQEAVVALESKMVEKAEKIEAKATPAPEATPETPEPPAKVEPEAPAAALEGEEEPEESADSGGDDPTAPRKKNRGVGKRIDELTKEKYEGIRRAQAAEARLAELERQFQARQPQQPPNATALQGRPTLEQFGYDQEAYEAARDTWVISQARESWTQQQQQAEVQRQQQERLGKFEQRIAKFEQEQPGAWDEVLRSPVQPTQLMREAVADSDIGPKMAHYLAVNLDEAFSITQLPPLQQAIAMGRIEAKLASAPPPSSHPKPPPATTRAPAPPPVLPSGSPSGVIPLERMGIEDHIAAVRAKKLAKLQG